MMKMAYNKKMRDKIGLAVAFLLGVLLGGLGTVTMVLRECWQSYKGGFEIETADVVRYSLMASVGAVVNVIILLFLF